MMMKCLVAGGVVPIWSKFRENDMHLGDEKYRINPDKFYEVGQEKYMRLGFTSELPNECCVKIQAIGLPILAAAKGYKIVYMRRDPEAIKQSYIDSFGEKDFHDEYKDWPAHYWRLLDGVKAIMETRRDVELLELQYEDVLAAMKDAGNLFAMTRSEKGSVIVQGDTKIVQEAKPIEKLIDTTGAGDAYAAAFLYGWANDKPLDECARLGTHVATSVIQQLGARIETNVLDSY